MNPIAVIRQQLAEHDGAQYEEGENWIRYIPSSAQGFVVELSADPHGYIVAFDGWHEQLDDAESAVKCFMFGLSDACRLKIVSRGGTPYKWAVESRNDGNWIDDSTTGILQFAFWRQSRVEYRQNSIIESIGSTA